MPSQQQVSGACVCLHVGVQAGAVHTVYTPCVPVCAFMLGCRLVQYIQYILPVYLCVPLCWGAG